MGNLVLVKFYHIIVARVTVTIEGMQPQINDMEHRIGIMQSVEHKMTERNDDLTTDTALIGTFG